MTRGPHNILRLLSRLLAAISALLGIYILAGVAYEYHYARASMNWPSTQGELWSYHDVYPRNFQSRYGNRSEVVNVWELHYRYTVAGEQYLGSRTSFGQVGRQAPDPIVQSRVTVYYNPQWPSQSVLLPGPSDVPWGLIAFGIALLGMGFVLPKLGAKLT
jgi:hypothetical protein